MDRRECLKLVAGLAIPGAQHAQQRRTVSEYCFRINPHFTIKAHETIATPAQYLTAHPEAKAAINGPQYNRTDGLEQVMGVFHYRGSKRER
jgi:hypothetical protein